MLSFNGKQNNSNIYITLTVLFYLSANLITMTHTVLVFVTREVINWAGVGARLILRLPFFRVYSNSGTILNGAATVKAFFLYLFIEL